VNNTDILKLDLGNLPKNYKVVANIPYYLTSNLLRVFSEAANPPLLAVLLVQKELAKRVCATPGDMSILSVATQMYFKPDLGQVVLAKLFEPKPKVDSQILVLQRRQTPLFGQMDPEILFKVVKAGFSSKRKKLRSSLAGGLGLTKEQATKLLESANIYPQLRAQNLSLQDWLSLTNSWAAYKLSK
jgi:16S rRNA (adenine1518-N6/adenine1519-N6)-dimethyltransferase